MTWNLKYRTKLILATGLPLLFLGIAYGIYKYDPTLGKEERAILNAAKKVFPDYTQGRSSDTGFFANGTGGILFTDRAGDSRLGENQSIQYSGENIAVNVRWEGLEYALLIVSFSPPGYERECVINLAIDKSTLASQGKDYYEEYIKGKILEILSFL